LILEGSDSSWEITGFDGSRVSLWSEAKKNYATDKIIATNIVSRILLLPYIQNVSFV